MIDYTGRNLYFILIDDSSLLSVKYVLYSEIDLRVIYSLCKVAPVLT
jgi:hypothetical protein